MLIAPPEKSTAKNAMQESGATRCMSDDEKYDLTGCLREITQETTSIRSYQRVPSQHPEVARTIVFESIR